MSNIISYVLEFVQNDKEYLQEIINELQDIYNNMEDEEGIPLF